MHKDCEYILLDESKIKELVLRLSSDISNDYKGKKLLLVGLLKGSAVFISDLMREISLDIQVDFMCVSSYGRSTVSSGDVKIIKDVTTSLKGFDVLIVEDIVDSGNTLKYIKEYLQSKGTESVKICSLLSKPSRREAHVDIDYLGSEISDEFVVGYGLDFDERYRNLPYIGVLKTSVYS